MPVIEKIQLTLTDDLALHFRSLKKQSGLKNSSEVVRLIIKQTTRVEVK